MSDTQKIAFAGVVVLIILVGGLLISKDRENEIPHEIPQPPVTSTSTSPLPATSTLPTPPIVYTTSTPNTPTAPSTGSTTTLIRVTNPTNNQLVKSPFTLRGEARGPWYFEASFPAKLLDANGKQLAQLPVQAQGEWMTEAFVPFTAEIRFATPTTDTGTLVLEKDNPSGLPEYAAEYRIPVRFDRSAPVATTTEQRTIKLYYYDPKKDTDTSGNVLCSEKGLVAVERTIPRTLAVIRDAIEQLLKGELTTKERAQGVTTQFPLPGVTLKLAVLKDSALTLTFNDPKNQTTGGACRASVLQAQIEATAKQFGGVKTIKFQPENVFQP